MNGTYRRGAARILELFAFSALSLVWAESYNRPIAFGVQDDLRVPIADLDFESDMLPAGWEAWDAFARAEGVPDRHMWASDSCETWADRGGDASGWALRGGVVGMALPCGGSNTEPVDTLLTYGPIDSRPFVNGVEVALDVKLNLAFEEAFLVCMSTNDLEEPLACFSAGVTETDWASFEPAIHFADGGGQAAAMVYVLFRDRDPSPVPPRFGAYVDNIVIVGLAPPATPTSAATATPSGSTTPSTPGPTTATPTETTPIPGSPTVTVAPGATETESATPSPEVTADATPTLSGSGSPTATGTATATSTATPIELPTEAATATFAAPTESPSPIPTQEATEDPGDGTPASIYLPRLFND